MNNFKLEGEPVYFAHSANKQGEMHRLTDHLLEVACLSERFASSFGLSDFGYNAGILHDIGKFSQEFQKYLNQCSGKSQDCRGLHREAHSVYGCYFCRNDSEFIRPIIAGHHAGIYASHQIGDLLNKYENKSKDIIKTAGEFIKNHLRPVYFPDIYSKDYYAQETLLRFLFSCLIDADSLSTHFHFKSQRIETPAYPSLQECKEFFLKRYYAEFGYPNRFPGELNSVRREIYRLSINKANLGRGVFKLTAPTGSGKTLALMAFALHHACANDLQRIIIALPFTSIIDQNAKIYREYLPDGALLEHHSALEIDKTEEDETSEDLIMRDSAPNWDQPVIITTNNQLFESLFSNKRSRCRKLHNIVNSIIVLDEAQALPPPLLDATTNMLSTIHKYFGVSITLSTATQPSLEKFISPKKDDVTTIEIIDNPRKFFKKMERVEYKFDLKEVTWEELAKDIQKQKRILVILNTKKDAISLWKKLEELKPFHLSTLLCPSHRKKVMRDIKERLTDGHECRVISTQVVEAGVDLDFPIVYRAFGPLDRIVQAAGRCNRERKLKKGLVRIFFPSEGGAPRGEYNLAMESTHDILRQNEFNPHDPKTYERFFQIFYRSIDIDRHKIQERRRNLDFPAVNEKYKFIDDGISVIISNYPRRSPAALRIISGIKAKGFISKNDWKNLQAHSISVPKYQFQEYLRKKLIKESIVPNLYVWEADYHEYLGIGTYGIIDPADLIIGDN